MSFEFQLSRFRAMLATSPAECARLIDELIRSIPSYNEFSLFMSFLDENLVDLVPRRESFLADDYIGAFSMVVREQRDAPSTDFLAMNSDWAKAAYCLVIALSAE